MSSPLARRLIRRSGWSWGQCQGGMKLDPMIPLELRAVPEASQAAGLGESREAGCRACRFGLSWDHRCSPARPLLLPAPSSSSEHSCSRGSAPVPNPGRLFCWRFPGKEYLWSSCSFRKMHCTPDLTAISIAVARKKTLLLQNKNQPINNALILSISVLLSEV